MAKEKGRAPRAKQAGARRGERRGRAPLEVWRLEMLGGSPVRPREEVAWRKGEEAAACAQRWILPDLHRLSKVSVLRGARGGRARAQTPQDSLRLTLGEVVWSEEGRAPSARGEGSFRPGTSLFGRRRKE